MNNYNNNYYNPQPQIKTAEMVLAEIDQAIKDTIQYTSVSKITATLDRLRQAGDIVDVGTGTNRRIIQLSDRYDLSQLKARYAPTLANKAVVFKIPFKVQEGRVDNLREAFITQSTYRLHISNPDFKYLLQTLPESYMLKEPLDTCILMAEFVTPGELSQQVQNMIQRDGERKHYDEYGNAKRASYLTEYLTSNSLAIQQLEKLVFTLDKYFVMADINPIYSPCNYGFKKLPSGEEILTILDLGYVLPKESVSPVCPKCGGALKYVTPTEDIVTKTGPRGQALTRKLGLNGLYSCKNDNCTEGSTAVFTSYPDETVFFEHVQRLRDLWSQNMQTYSLLQYL